VTTSAKKLIEVALPLEAINKASAREKSIRHGHPSTLHLWWARRPLAAARAVIFAQMVDDPSARPDLFPTAKAQEKERRRLFKIIEDLVQWENTTNETVLQRARDEIWESWRRACADNADHPRADELFDRNKLPAFHDPFAGGGALPLEAQRFGLVAHASDLNPVAVLICKAMIEIPPKFAGRPPVNPEWQAKSDGEKALMTWMGAQGLAEDVRYYGKWMRDEAEKRIGHLYPKVEVTAEMAKDRPDLRPYVGKKLTVIAWLWARTVKSPNPAFSDVEVPLASTFMLSTKAGKEAYVEPVIEDGSYRFTVKVGKPKDPDATKAGTKLARANFQCLMSGTPIPGDYSKAEGQAGRMGARLMAIVAEGQRGRVYLSPTPEMEAAALDATPEWKPGGEVPAKLTGGTCVPYGLSTWGDLFTDRQLVALTTFSDLVRGAHEQILEDAIAAGFPDNGLDLDAEGLGATSHADAVATYLGCGISRLANRSASICVWNKGGEKIEQVFARQAIPMTWDFPESNPFSNSTGGWSGSLEWIPSVIEKLPPPIPGRAAQEDASVQSTSYMKMISTDPPYFDNIGYADLSDFFYVWLRASLGEVFPSLFSTLATPKAQELVAISSRHGGKDAAEAFFVEGMTGAMQRLRNLGHPAFPVTVYYSFKQSESDAGGGTFSTGWETFLEAVIRAGFGIVGTWPMRTERDFGVKSGTNVLASSIVLVCRDRPDHLAVATRGEFIRALRAGLPGPLRHLQAANIAPVDLAQAAVGPGIGVFSWFSKVLEADGSAMSVREALALINRVLDEVLAEQESEFDPSTRWALAWFESHGNKAGAFGEAEVLSKAKDVSVAGLERDGIVESAKGKVRLLAQSELTDGWDPLTDHRLTVWEATQHLAARLGAGGEAEAAALLAKLGGSLGAIARDLGYRLYSTCERKKWAHEALVYNALVTSWPEIVRLAASESIAAPVAGTLFQEP